MCYIKKYMHVVKSLKNYKSNILCLREGERKLKKKNKISA